ncbi:hypothetical protein [Actinomadura rudentiformis]|uniref:Uncharacterized protein n=1 Tax=Actinomadura rudentiformis TaxID=359158 RepID=A0A6H9YRY9_9ACTN|nr:hypothetical protein [Actinomadura rudentiformis]KAB2350912.1 hypothetical protein F8566_08125 [Actinomadura rudentiformis]
MRMYARFSIATAIGVGLLATSVPQASAAAPHTDFTCKSPKGDVGTVRVFHSKDTFKVTSMHYKIKLAGPKRHHNNVYVHDYKAAPGKTDVVSKTGDNGKGDNKWHKFREKDYSRSNKAKLYVKFDFDHSGADPHCDDFGPLKKR